MRRWLERRDDSLKNDIFLDLDGGILPGKRWKDALRQAVTRCEAVVCLLSPNWERSHECVTEYRHAESLNKPIFPVRLHPSTGTEITGDWQWVDLFGDGPATTIDVDDGEPVAFLSAGLDRFWRGIDAAGIGAESFRWPPPNDPDRVPYRGWAPLEDVDAAVFFGRDAQIIRGLDALRGMRKSGVETLFVIPGPSGAGKSSFLRAGLLPRLRRDDRHFLTLEIVRPGRNAVSGEKGLANAIYSTRCRLGLSQPQLGEIKTACLHDATRVNELLREAQHAARSQLHDVNPDFPLPTVVLPVDQGEELFSTDAGTEAKRVLELIGQHASTDPANRVAMIVAVTIRTDHSEELQTASALTDVKSVAFHDLRPLPRSCFKEVITGPARRASESPEHPLRLKLEPQLIEQLLADCTEGGGDTLPLLAMTLSRLYEEYGRDGDLTLAEYEQMGLLRYVVETEIDTLLSRDEPTRRKELKLLRSSFIPHLVNINLDSDEAVRRVARWDDLPADAHELLEKFIARRLLVRSGDLVEVALESLFRLWSELEGWLDKERDNLKKAEALERNAAEWHANSLSPEWLIGGTRLEDAGTLAQTPGFRKRLSIVADYLAASREAENQKVQERERIRQAELQAERDRTQAAQEREQHAQETARLAQAQQAETERHAAVVKRKSRTLSVVLAITSIVAIVAIASSIGVYYKNQESAENLRRASSRKLIAESQGMLTDTRSGSDAQALQLILAAGKISDTPNDQALYGAVARTAGTLKVVETPGALVSVAFSPEGHRIATGGRDGEVRLWDAHSGRRVQLSGAHRDSVNAVQFSPYGDRLASGSSDGTIRLWDADTGIEELATEGRGNINDLAFSPDGRLIVYGSQDGTWVWPISSGKEPVRLSPKHPMPDLVLGVAFSQDGQRLASGSNDGTLRLWDRRTGGRAIHFNENKPSVFGVAFSPDGRRLASANADKTIRIWDTGTQTVVRTLRGHTEEVTGVAYIKDNLLVSASYDQTIQLWDPIRGESIGPSLMGHDGAMDIAITHDGTRMASASIDHTLRLWDVAASQPMASQPRTKPLAINPDGGRVAFTRADDNSVWLSEAQTGTNRPLNPRHDQDVTSAMFSPDGRFLVTGSFDKTARVWDAATGALLKQLKTDDAVLSVAFSHDGRRIATGAFSGDFVQVWDVATGREIGRLTGQTSSIAAVAFSPNGRMVASGEAQGALWLWDMSAEPPTAKPLRGDLQVLSVAFSPDNRRVAAGGNDNTVRLWDTTTGEPIGDPITSQNAVYSLAFSRDGTGTRLVTGSSDGSVQLWDVATDRAQPVGDSIVGHQDKVTTVAFSADGGRDFFSGAADGIVRTWPTMATAEDLCNKLTENMSRKQWSEWVSPEVGYEPVCEGLPVRNDEAN